jgi:hypothetical protein
MQDKICMIDMIRRCEQYMVAIGVSHEYAIMKDIRKVLKKMDTVITCTCGNQSWTIGYSGTRCCKCGKFLEPGSVTADIDAVNNSLHNSEAGR